MHKSSIHDKAVKKLRLGLFTALSWISCASAYAACTAPEGVEGEIIFNRQWKVMQFCDGTHWIGMGGQNNDPITAAGNTGTIQFKGADGNLAANTKLFWDIANEVLYIPTISTRALGVTSELAPSSGLSVRFYEDAVNNVPANTWHFRQGSSRTSNISFGNYDNVPSIFIRGVTAPTDIRVGIATTSPSYRLHVNGSVAGTGAYNALSDARFKTNINDMPYGLDDVKKLRPVTYEWITPQDEMQKGEKLGLIAQEVEAIFPQAVSTADDGTKSIAYDELIPVLINAIKELEARLPPPAEGGY